MRLLVLSDLHLEMSAPYAVPEGVDYDAVILAGDITTPGRQGIHWAARESVFGGRPVFYVAGNHEFYRAAEVERELQAMEEAAAGTSVHLLHRKAVVVGGVRFLGCTLWTDFRVRVEVDGRLRTDVARALSTAARRLNDYSGLITTKADPTFDERSQRMRDRSRYWTPADSMAAHWIDREWLRAQLAEPYDGPTVVVTHHAPTRAAIHPRYGGDWLTPCFVSELEPEFFAGVDLWVYGHTHSSLDQQAGRCRIVSNPRGYRRRDGSFENEAFGAVVVGIGT